MVKIVETLNLVNQFSSVTQSCPTLCNPMNRGMPGLPVHHQLPEFIQTHGLIGSPCSPRDSQESSPTPQFKNINSSALSFLYGPTLLSVRDYLEILLL